ncbi:MAG: hypothetical protein ACRBHB_18660 [Arenicella sp.]
MAHETVVYGFIEGATYTQENYRKYQNLNLEILQRLPDKDEYPYLSRQMFSAPPANNSQGTFRVQVIHFGGSIKGLEWEEIDVWISKFENLLKQLYWFSAVAHINPEIDSNYQFTWLPKQTPLSIHQEYGKLLPVTEWTREKIYRGEVVESI